jgi:hypothetical protein
MIAEKPWSFLRIATPQIGESGGRMSTLFRQIIDEDLEGG